MPYKTEHLGLAFELTQQGSATDVEITSSFVPSSQGSQRQWIGQVKVQGTAVWPTPMLPISRDRIREIFMANGFTIKEGQTDLKDYVYAAAHALLVEQAAVFTRRINDLQKRADAGDKLAEGFRNSFKEQD
jgi:polysaccharide deacetylase 2 family uncharacterized protein YibQ